MLDLVLVQPELQVVGDVVFTTDRDGNDEIYVMALDGTSQTRLTNDAGVDDFASFSPDQGEIVFQTDRDGDTNVYLVNSDGSKTRESSSWPRASTGCTAKKSGAM